MQIDIDIGMKHYGTNIEGVGGMTRVRSTDFIVDEIVEPGITASVLSTLSLYIPFRTVKTGIFILEKSNIDTITAIELLSKKLRLKPRNIGYAGLKDKRSYSFQRISIERITPINATKATLGLKRVRIHYIGEGRRVVVGSNPGNYFKITVRNVNAPNIEAEKIRVFPNYYGYQRFGYSKPYNHEIGRFLIMKNFKAAIEAIVGGRGRGYEEKVKEYISNKSRDYIGALRRIPKKVLRLYVQSFQSYLFNLYLSRRLEFSKDLLTPVEGELEVKIKNLGFKEKSFTSKVPAVRLPGYGFKERGTLADRIMGEVMNSQGIRYSDFLIKSIPEISVYGGIRKIVAVPRIIGVKTHGNNLSIEFCLERGEYASVFLREIMKPKNPVLAGL